MIGDMEAKPKKVKKKPLAMRDFFRNDVYLTMEEIGRQLDEIDVEWEAKRLFGLIRLEYERYYRKFGEEIIEIDPDYKPWLPECPEWRPMRLTGKRPRKG